MCKNDCSKADWFGRGIGKQLQLRLYWKGRHGEGRAEKGNLSESEDGSVDTGAAIE